jgi:hypothetical protein
MTANDGSPHPMSDAGPDSIARDDALRRAVRLTVVQELADEMAHDLNNVLTVIAGSLQLFMMQQGGETAKHHFVRNAVDAALRGAQMTGNLLAYASPQVVDVQEINLVEVVQGVAPLLRETLGSAKALEIAPHAGPAAAHGVVADRRFIESALLALGSIVAAKTAKDVSPDGTGQITLQFSVLSPRDAALRSGAVSGQCGFVQLSMRCAAKGLSSDVIRQAITPAFGAAAVDRPALDLSAAYASIRQSGGDIGVEPLDPTGHGGFVVSILLPQSR